MFGREHENRMRPDSGKEWLLYPIGGLLGLLLILAGLGCVTNRVACGYWSAPSGFVDPLRFITTGDGRAFGTGADECAAPGGAIIAVWIVFGGLLIAAVIAGLVAWRRHVQSDAYFIRALRRREGFARRSEISEAMGAKAAKGMTGKVRPTLPAGQRSPERGNIAIGDGEGVRCWVGLEESLLLLGPPRSGKGVNLIIGAIIDSPGPVITTSSRADNYAATAPVRAKRGPVTLFDPQGLTGKATTVKWSPITGCEKPQTANQRATSLISAAGLSADGSNAEWRAPAIQIMQSLLHAAALSGGSVDELMRWGSAPSSAKAAVQVLRQAEAGGHGTPGWADALESEIEGDPKMRANKWFGVSNAVQGLSVESVRACLNPHTAEETFDIDRFIAESGTLYIVGTKTGGASAGPFLIAMMDAITERAREIAAQREGNRLDPPMTLVLDEIANIASAWDGLIPLMADGGGVGISPWVVLQSLAQARNNWGKEAADSLFDAATVKLQLGGASNPDDLATLQKLSGPRQVIRSSRNRQTDGTSVSDQIQDREVVEIVDLRRLPFGWAIVFFRNRRPVLMRMRPYWKRADSAEIKSSQEAFAASLLDEDAAGEWVRLVGRRAEGVQLALPAPPMPALPPAVGRSQPAESAPDVTIF